ncbi:MAG: putative signal transducing protein [Sphingomonas sp.]
MALAELGRFDRNLAYIIVGRLEAEGIPALTFDGEASIADGSHFLIPVRVMVDADDLADARALVAAGDSAQ